MPYLGRPLISDKTTKTKKIDNIASSFNSAQTVFSLTSSGASVYPASSRNLFVSINGVLQEPDVAYTISAATITFTSAPTTGATFFCVVNGEPNDLLLTPAVSSMTVGANVSVNTSTVFLGNGSVNTAITSSSMTVGANVSMNATTVFVGNSSVNSSHTATTLAVYANSTVNTIISAASANAITINGLTVGYLEVPQNSQSAAYTTVLADSGKHIFHPGSDNNARTFTIPANANVAYPIGTVLTFVSMANTVTIAITTDTMYLAGNGATGSRTLAANGIATALKINSSAWLISGTGLT